MRQITFCVGELCGAVVMTIPDDRVVKLGNGLTKTADQLVACTKAALQIDGQDANGHVVYTSGCGGEHGNALRVAHEVGQTGAGHENRTLAVSAAGADVTVTFGTDGAGASVVPTAAQVVALIQADPAVSRYFSLAAGGDGSGLVGTQALTNLVGGLDDGDTMRPPFDLRSTMLVNKIEDIT